jgi:thiol:disulfide interchange protein DsbC
MRQIIIGLIVLTLLAAAPVYAQDEFDVVEQRIRALAPSARFIAVSETPVDGILQVQINGDIVYTTSDGKYLLQGRLIDLDTREDLTERSKSGIRKELIDEIDMTNQIVFTPEEPEFELMVFTDIDCGYCRKLHSQMEEYNEQGIAIRYMAFPRAGIGSHSYEKAVSVWCAADQQAAMTNAKAGSEPDPVQCDNPVAEQYQLGTELGVTGTPALLTSDGMLIPGYVPPATLKERLEKMAAAE